MAVEISDGAGITLMEQYVSLRDTPRMLMARRIYGAAKRALVEYQALVDFLGENAEYVALHDATTAQVQTHIPTLVGALETIVETMETVESEVPGTFPGVGG